MPCTYHVCVVYVWAMLQALGISVEFCAHVVHAFVVAPGTRPERMTAAVTDVGASVLSGITLTKFVGAFLIGRATKCSALLSISSGSVLHSSGTSYDSTCVLYVCRRCTPGDRVCALSCTCM